MNKVPGKKKKTKKNTPPVSDRMDRGIKGWDRMIGDREREEKMGNAEKVTGEIEINLQPPGLSPGNSSRFVFLQALSSFSP